MNIAIFDTETTGLDPTKDRVLQYGILIWDMIHNRVVEARSWVAWLKDFPVTGVSNINGWNLDLLVRYGRHPHSVLRELNQLIADYQIRAVVAHNAPYDKSMLRAEFLHWMRSANVTHNPDDLYEVLRLPWLDTMRHAVWEGCPSKALLAVAAFNNYINPFAHDALSDSYTLAVLLDRNPGLVDRMAQNAAEPQILVMSNTRSNPKEHSWDDIKEDNALVKAKGFHFEKCDDHFYSKTWIRKIPKRDFVNFTKDCNFTVSVLKELPAEDCYVNLLKELTDSLGGARV